MTEVGQACIFPFTYKGITYNSCTDVEEDRPWCATGTDYEGNLDFGFCESSCFVEPQQYVTNTDVCQGKCLSKNHKCVIDRNTGDPYCQCLEVTNNFSDIVSCNLFFCLL